MKDKESIIECPECGCSIPIRWKTKEQIVMESKLKRAKEVIRAQMWKK